MPLLYYHGISAIIPYMAKYEDVITDTTNMFRVLDKGYVDGEMWYTVWADGVVIAWIMSYDITQWITYANKTFDMTDGMLTMLKLKFSDREIPNPYLGIIPSVRFNLPNNN